MTDPTASTPSSPPAGWYPDPAGTSSERYWNGSSWTEQLRGGAQPQQQSAQQQYQPQQQAAQQQYQQDTGVPRYQPYRAPMQRLAEGTSTITPWIWVVVLLPVLSIIAFLTWDVRGYYESTFRSLEAPPSTTPLFPAIDGGTIALSLVGWLVYLLTPLFAFLDWRALRARGVDRPFHWAWAFLFTPTYVIGRSVVVRRRSGGGLTPLWVYIGVAVLYVVVYLAKIAEGLVVVSEYVSSTTSGF